MTAPLPAFTIVSNNYLASARVWADSYRRFHPDAPLFACIVDRPHPAVDYARLPFTAIFVEALGIPDFQSLAFRYDILELNTAVKPFFLEHLRDHHGFTRALYFDPDIQVLDALPELASGLDTHAALLTPHITEPDVVSTERLYLRVGVYNLGFLGLRLDDSTRGFLDWWKERLAQFCVHEAPDGMFVDQCWMDLAPAFLDSTGVLRDPIYNVAYWNLAQRHPRLVDGRWEQGGKRIGFVHFSGYDPDQPDQISAHRRGLDFVARPELRPLFDGYAQLLREADHERLRLLPYAFGAVGDMKIPALARRILRRVDPEARRFRDPFDTSGPDSFIAWLTEPARSRTGVLNRLVLALWEDRSDLVRTFPRVRGEDLPRFVAWVRAQGEQQGIPRAWCEVIRSESSDAPPTATLSPFEAGGTDPTSALLQRVDLRQPGPLVGWLNEPDLRTALPKPVLTRAAMLVHSSRHDVAVAYPDPLGADQHAYAYWFCHVASQELELHRDLVAPVLRGLPLRARLSHMVSQWTGASASVAPAPAAPPLPPPQALGAAHAPVGVNLAGYFGMDTGVGEVGRGTLLALEHAGEPVARVPLDEKPWVLRGRVQPPHGAPYGVTLVHANADRTGEVLRQLPAAALAGGTVVGYWFWELAHFPLALTSAFDGLAELWAPSRFCQQSFAAVSPVPVRLVEPCLPAPAAATSDRASFGLDAGRFYFLFCFDARSVPERKNPAAVIEAFRRASEAAPGDTGLVLRIHHAASGSPLVKALREQARGMQIVIDVEPMPQTRFDSLLRACDAFVSLHRSEGLGLLPIRALQMGKPVVATGYGGVMDYLDADTGYPVDFRLVPLGRDHGPYPRGAVWAEPSVEHAAALMRRVMQAPSEAAARAQAGRARVLARYGLEAAALRFESELARLRAMPAVTR